MNRITNWTVASLRPRLRLSRPRRYQAFAPHIDPGPLVARAVKPPERAGFDAERIRAPHIDRAVIGVAAGLAVDAAAPLPLALRLHVDQDGLALVVRGRV